MFGDDSYPRRFSLASHPTQSSTVFFRQCLSGESSLPFCGSLVCCLLSPSSLRLSPCWSRKLVKATAKATGPRKGGGNGSEARGHQSQPSPSIIRLDTDGTIAEAGKRNEVDVDRTTDASASGGMGDGDITMQRSVLLGAAEGVIKPAIRIPPEQGNTWTHLLPNLNKKIHPLSLSNYTEEGGSDNLSLSLDLEGGSEGDGARWRREHVPAHLAPMVREWLREQRENNGYLPNSFLRTRPTKHYDGSIGGSYRSRGVRFSPYHSVERLIAIPSPRIENDPTIDPPHETSHT